MMRRVSCLLVVVMACVFCLGIGICFGKEKVQEKKAIVLASFGTTYPEALVSIINIYEGVQKAFPEMEVRLAFTSNIIRKIWHKRQKDVNFLNEHKEIPEDILYVQTPLATIANLQDEGYKTIIVQPTHLFAGEEFQDLSSYVTALNSIQTIKDRYRPFNKLVLGRPLLGMPGPQHDYHHDIEVAAQALKKDVEQAQKNGAALVYMGHGNEFYSTGAYIELQETMRRMYPGTKIFVGTVEGFPSLDDVVSGLTHFRVKKVLLKPLMIVAGDHARNDMAGTESDSWKNVIAAKGIKVIPCIQGLGENEEIVNIFVQHIKDAANDNKIDL